MGGGGGGGGGEGGRRRRFKAKSAVSFFEHTLGKTPCLVIFRQRFACQYVAMFLDHTVLQHKLIIL